MSQELFDAVTHGVKSTVYSIMQEQSDLINFVFENDKSVFEYAVARGYTMLAKSLIDLPGFDLDFPGHNPLRAAISSGYDEIGAILLEKGANPNSYQENQGSLLWLCLENGCFELAEKTLEHGAEIDVRDERGWTILIYAAYTGLEKIVDFLLEHHASINICTNDGWSAIVGAYAKNLSTNKQDTKPHG